MQLLVQRLDLLRNFSFYGSFLRLFLVSILVPPCSDANTHEEISDLVSVLDWCWDLDWTSPVEVKVTQGVGQHLNVEL